MRLLENLKEFLRGQNEKIFSLPNLTNIVPVPLSENDRVSMFLGFLCSPSKNQENTEETRRYLTYHYSSKTSDFLKEDLKKIEEDILRKNPFSLFCWSKALSKLNEIRLERNLINEVTFWSSGNLTKIDLIKTGENLNNINEHIVNLLLSIDREKLKDNTNLKITHTLHHDRDKFHLTIRVERTFSLESIF